MGFWNILFVHSPPVMKNKNKTDRRGFLGSIAAGAAAGFAPALSPVNLYEKGLSSGTLPADDPDEWFKQIKGKHRIVFDVTRPHENFPFAWPRVFLITNIQTGTPENQQSVVVVLRNKAIAYAFEDRLWSKYKFGEVFTIEDPGTKVLSVRNPFWKPKPGDFKMPGLGNAAIGINELQNSGVMFCVCNSAITGHSEVLARQMNLDPEKVRKDWLSGLLPDIQIVPSGVWAVGRAQEHGCAYCFAG
jgi:intracellular sulfur oxidation DsrE/DsrF family protein